MIDSPSGLVVVVAPIALLVIVLIVALLLRRRVQEKMFPGSGMREWATTAAGLSLRERFAIERANTRGRAAPPHLAAAAAQRGRRTAAMTERLLTPGTGARRFWLVVALLWAVLLAVFFVLALAEPTRWQHWFQVLLAVYWLGFIWYLIGPAQRRLRERLLRSVAANDAIAASNVGSPSRPGISRDETA